MVPQDRFLEFCERMLALDASVIFSALVDHLGDIVAMTYRETPFVDEKEAKQYAIQMTIVTILLAHFENRLGSIQYTVTYHDGVARVTLPVAAGNQKFFVLLLLESGSDVVSVMKDKISPFVMKSRGIL
ncbi:hypothetical protein [Nitrososphaera viennensis]|uniref:Roadblock/LAMTOR2 domain-containing protein n=2 Tax=Nitrososphaera viennensis TaxID=1034015 RepID=A0A060HNU3_9ARCH|nr:hypothetical protein [Nitrososphaera viennensis]AIC15236.1 hypothetical protein NVIE_010100 [Nitrososphaera viennensis EN76]UVS70151.1 hypothetical protein NWT39_05020 [Nitrososphaera viennensis]